MLFSPPVSLSSGPHPVVLCSHLRRHCSCSPVLSTCAIVNSHLRFSPHVFSTISPVTSRVLPSVCVACHWEQAYTSCNLNSYRLSLSYYDRVQYWFLHVYSYFWWNNQWSTSVRTQTKVKHQTKYSDARLTAFVLIKTEKNRQYLDFFFFNRRSCNKAFFFSFYCFVFPLGLEQGYKD